MLMMTIISAMIIITKYSLPTIDFAILIGTRIFGYNPTRTLLEVKKKPTRGCLVMILWTSFMVIVQCVTPDVSASASASTSAFDMSCHLAFPVILAIIVIIVTKVFMALMLTLLSI